ncbi:MAG: hypothetical protein LBU95_03135 [Rikenellaceae bacterium]|nr:hypothetical protein [Rikenellaceae bacterium]
MSTFIWAVSVLWCVIIYFMCYNIYRLQYTADALAGELRQADREEAEGGFSSPGPDSHRDVQQADERQGRLLASFEKLLGEDMIFLQSDLRLDAVARMLRTNRTYISRIINERYGCSSVFV